MAIHIERESNSPAANAICSLCRFPSWNVDLSLDEGGVVHIASYNELQRSAELGCPGCTILYESWTWCVAVNGLQKTGYLYFNLNRSTLTIRVSPGGVYSLDVFTLPGWLSPHFAWVDSNFYRLSTVAKYQVCFLASPNYRVKRESISHSVMDGCL